MKRATLQIGLFTLVIIAGLAFAGFGLDRNELVAIAESGTINRIAPSISMAAGTELAKEYAETKTQAELENLVMNGATAGIRTAARLALSIVYSSKTVVELTALATGDIDPAIRKAATAPLQLFLVEMAADDLYQMAISGATKEIRLAAADMYYLKTRDNLTAASLEVAACSSDSEELEYMAGVYLGGFYLSFNKKTMEQVEALAKSGACAGLKVAGATALTSYLITTGLTVEDLEVAVTEIDPAKYPELLTAYEDALAHAYGS